jgi:hypothetical protein
MQPRYRLCDLFVENTPVWWTLGQGEVRGVLKITRRGNRIYRVVTGYKRTEDLPEHAEPMLWRPVDMRTWPEPLPPVAATVAPPSVELPKVSEPEEWAESGQGWPYPSLRLGGPREKPATIQEAEARILRCVRTYDHLERVESDVVIGFPRKTWPGPLMVASQQRHEMLRSSRTGRIAQFTAEDYDHFHVDRSELDARPLRWMPTARDIGDCEAGVIRWLDAVSHSDQRIIRLRSANPPFSWRLIADHEGGTHDKAKQRYADAMKQVYRRARR